MKLPRHDPQTQGARDFYAGVPRLKNPWGCVWTIDNKKIRGHGKAHTWDKGWARAQAGQIKKDDLP